MLFLDEPFGALDALTRETLQQELAGLGSQSDRPVTTVMITNSVEEAILLSDRIVPMIPGPPATLGAPIPVELPRPRSVAQLAHDEQATHVRAHVVATLTASLGRLAESLPPNPRAASPVLQTVVEGDADERSARAHRADEGLPDADRSVRRRQGRQRRSSRPASSSRSSATPAAASRRCCRSSPGSIAPRSAASSSTARR